MTKRDNSADRAALLARGSLALYTLSDADLAREVEGLERRAGLSVPLDPREEPFQEEDGRELGILGDLTKHLGEA